VAEGSEAPGESFFQWAARLFDPANRHGKPEALRGIRVLDLSVGLTGRDRAKGGNRDPVFVPSGIYACRDGHVALVAGTDAEFQGLAEALGRPDLARDERFATAPSRRANADAIDTSIRDWCATRSRADVEASARRHGFAAAPVMSARDQYADPHFRARGSVEELDDHVYGRVVDYGPAPQLSATPARHKWAGRPVGWHTGNSGRGPRGAGPSTT
jgi:crotonobetainyl-CoA:carnitine CoA-transferase CaiB-like acyl-CoA transferase